MDGKRKVKDVDKTKLNKEENYMIN